MSSEAGPSSSSSKVRPTNSTAAPSASDVKDSAKTEPQEEEDPAVAALPFAVKEWILCYHGRLIYKARVLDRAIFTAKDTPNGTIGPQYFVHYDKWSKKWDDWVIPARVLKDTPANREKQSSIKADVEAEARAAKEAKKPQPTPSVVNDSPAGDKVPNSGRSVGAASGGGGDASTRSQKRKRETSGVVPDEEFAQSTRRTEMRLPMPDVLKVKLVDDWEYVTKHNRVVPLPRDPTVKQLLEEYKTFKRNNRPSPEGHQQAGQAEKPTRADALIVEVVSGLQVYFDKALGNNLLYRLERKQYTDLRKEMQSEIAAGKMESEKSMSEIYGAEHLLRLFVNLPMYINATTMDVESMKLIKEHVEDIMKWMIKEEDRIFLKEYENTSTVTQNLAKV